MTIFYDLALDLGTTYTLLFIPQLNLLHREPTFFAFNQRKGTPIASGEEAKKMVGFAPSHIEILQPLKDGVVVDFDHVSAFVRLVLQKVMRKKHFIFRNVLVSLPWGATDTERRAYQNQLEISGGISRIHLVQEPFAAALGVGYTLKEKTGILIVDIGGGTTEIALISLGGIVQCISLKEAGNRMDEAIREFLELHYRFSIGLTFAEKIKQEHASVYPVIPDSELEIKGFHRTYRLPHTIRISTRDIRIAIEPVVTRIMKGIESIFELMSPELAVDVAKNGFSLAGGGAYLKGWEKRLHDYFGISAHIPESPHLCVIKGMEKILRDLKSYSFLFLD